MSNRQNSKQKQRIADVQQQREQGNRNRHNNTTGNPTLSRQSGTFGNSRGFEAPAGSKSRDVTIIP